jgi:ubiquinone/menaquinone biosynthesis C-methylase UbiE
MSSSPASDRNVEIVRAGEFFAGTIGLAISRGWYEAGNDNGVRMSELRSVLDGIDSFPHSIELRPTEQTPLDGYEEWAASYDTDNPMIDAESNVVTPLLAAHAGPGVQALDAGCGTGRHAAFLAASGCTTTGVDQSAAMLDIARAKVPHARFVEGGFEALPLEGDSIDLAVASLALCHLPDPTPGVVELARVMRPGATLVIADPHPVGGITGGQAFYGGLRPGEPMPFVRNHHHLTSTWLRAFRVAGLSVEDCLEVTIDDALVTANPTSIFFADATRAAIHGLPYLFVWQLSKR